MEPDKDKYQIVLTESQLSALKVLLSDAYTGDNTPIGQLYQRLVQNYDYIVLDSEN